MSEERSFYRDTVHRILLDTVGKAEIDAAENGCLPAALYDALGEAGITRMLLPESDGGIGASLGDAAVLLREMGDAAAPGPLLETMLGQQLLARAGLEPVESLLSLVFVEQIKGLAGSQWNNAVLYDVPWSGAVGRVLVVARHGDGARLLVTNAADWTLEPGRDAAGEPRDRLAAAEIEVASGELGNFDEWLGAAAALRASQMLGAAEWAFRRSVEYASERKQFGREIGKFQAVQQMLAELAGHILASACIVEAACEDANPALIATARSRLGDAADAAVAISHQVHGALGFSQEYALNFRTRRLMAWRDDYGSVGYWRRTLASSFAGLDRDAFWPAIADAGSARAA